MTEKNEKAKAVEGYEPGKPCGPADRDNMPPQVPDTAVSASYPSESPKYSYNFEDSKHKVLVMFADGKHGPDRWDLTQNDPGTSAPPQHEHDAVTRLPPTVLQDADPKDSRIGFFAQYRVPDSPDALSVPGDELGLTTEQRAKLKKQ